MAKSTKGISLNLKTSDFAQYLGKQKHRPDSSPYWEITIGNRVFEIYSKNGENLWLHDAETTDKQKVVSKLKSCNEVKKNITKEFDVMCLQKILQLLRKKNNIESKNNNRILFTNFTKAYTYNLTKPLTFRDLFDHLKSTTYKTIHHFINTFSWNVQQRFEPQESVFRLFAFLKLITYEYNDSDLLKRFHITTKNFSEGKAYETHPQDPSAAELLTKPLKDSGDVSDLTFVNETAIIATSSKNYTDYSNKGNKLDLTKLQAIHQQFYNDKALITLLVVRNKTELEESQNNMSFSSKNTKELIQKAYKLDWDDLNKAYQCFKNDMTKNNWEFEEYFTATKSSYYPLHFKLLLSKTQHHTDPKELKSQRFYRGETINWTYKDEQHCVNILSKSSLEYLQQKCGQLLEEYSLTEIASLYSSMSKLNFIIFTDDYNPDSFLKSIFNYVRQQTSISGQIAFTHTLKTPLLSQLVQNNSFYGYSLSNICIIVENNDIRNQVTNFKNTNLQYTFSTINVYVLAISEITNIDLSSNDVFIFLQIDQQVENSIIKTIISENKKNKMYNFITTNTEPLQSFGLSLEIPTFYTSVDQIVNGHLLF